MLTTLTKFEERTLNPSVTLFGDASFKEVIRSNEVIKY